jgi:hypothetical protein
LTSEQIKILAVKLNISVAKIARKHGKTPQNFWKKMQRDSFTVKELKEIAQEWGIEYESHFILKNGEKI